MVLKRARVLCLTLVGVAVVSGCGQGLPSKGRLTTMLAEAAATTEADLLVAEEHGYWSEVENQTLTVVFAGTRPSEAPCGWEFAMLVPSDPPVIESLTDQWTFHELLRCLAPPEQGIWDRLAAGFRRGGDELPGKSISLLWSEFITEVEVSAEGNTAGGVVTFDHPGCFRGKVPFSMRRGDEGWEVVAFDLLDAGWRGERSGSGAWMAFRQHEMSGLPSFDRVENYVELHLKPAADGSLEVILDGIVIRTEEVSTIVAGQVVALRVDDVLASEHYHSVLAKLRLANPPLLALFTQSSNQIRDLWLCCLSMEMARRSPVQRLLEASGLASPLTDVPRSRLPRDVISLCVGKHGIVMTAPGSLPVNANEFMRYTTETVIEEIKRKPLLPVVISVGSGARYSEVDTALDIAVRSGAKQLFFATGSQHGIVFEIRKVVPPEPRSMTDRRAPGVRQQKKKRDPPQPVAPPSEPPSGETYRYVTGDAITEPVKLDGPEPIYSDAAKRARIQGVVVLDAVIGVDGVVSNLIVLRPLPLGLTETAVDAVKKWRYQPATLEGEPVPVKYIITVRFKLQ